MTYQVVLTHTEEGGSVNCPALHDCWSEGNTEAEALRNIRKAISEYLAAISEMNIGRDVRDVQVS